MIVPDYIERSNRKTLSLAVLRDGVILVKAPFSMKDEDINKFVCSKQDWIKSKLVFIDKTKDKFSDVMKYKKILLYGNEYQVVLGDVKKIQTSDEFKIIVPQKLEEDKVIKTLKSWLKQVAKQVISEREETSSHLKHGFDVCR